MNKKFNVFIGFAAILLYGCRTTLPPSKVVYEPVTQAHRDLAARARVAKAAAWDTPGREYANRLNSDEVARWLHTMEVEREAPKKEFEDAVGNITYATQLAEAGTNWPTPPLVKVPHAAAPITIDGKLDDPAWTNAVTFTGLYRFNSREKLSSPATTWKILWDETYLYFAFDCADRDIVAPKRDRDDAVYADDCVEMFILPEFRFRTYWELVVSPGGDIFDSVDCKQADLWGAILDRSQDMKGLKYGIQVRGTLNKQDDVDQGYTIEVAVPFSELPGYSRAAPQAGH